MPSADLARVRIAESLGEAPYAARNSGAVSVKAALRKQEFALAPSRMM